MKTYTTLIFCCFIITALAQKPGTLDSSFGEDGKLVTIVSPGYYNFNVCKEVMVQRDGKIIQAGGGSYENVGGFLMVRFKTNGEPDSSFGLNGRVVTSLFGSTIIYALAEQPDKKIVAAGEGGNGFHIALARYLPDGSLDSSFGTDGSGMVITNIDVEDHLQDMTLLPDGKIAVTGYLRRNENDIFRCFTVRYLPDGRLDESFGNAGVVITEFDSPTEMYAIAAQKDGKILVGGAYSYLTGNGDFIIVRYLTNGAVDTEFGENGYAKAGFGNIYNYSNAEIYSMVVQPDGKIVAAGRGGEGLDLDMAISRFNSSGSLDESFGRGGRTLATFGTEGTAESRANKVLLQPDGKLILAGRYSNNSTFAYFALARFASNGIIDSSFGNYGLQTTEFYRLTSANGAALQEDGKIVLGGNILDEFVEAQHFNLARYNGDKQTQWYARIKKWLHRHGFTWDDFPGNNINYYAVQRSGNGSAFTEIARLFSRNDQQRFSYEDAAPLSGDNYYRLAAVSADGSVTYSNVLTINNNANTIKIYPNPVKNNLRIEGLPVTEKTKLVITDFNGNTRMSAVVTESTYNWNIAQLKQGNYILKIENKNIVVTKKFVKE